MSSKIAKARKVMWDALENDPDFKLGYVANISMLMYDELHTRKYRPKLRKEDRDAISERLLKLIFDK